MSELPIILLLLAGAAVCIFGIRTIGRTAYERRAREEVQRSSGMKQHLFDFYEDTLKAKKQAFDGYADALSMSDDERAATWQQVETVKTNAVLAMLEKDNNKALQLMGEACALAEQIVRDLYDVPPPVQTKTH